MTRRMRDLATSPWLLLGAGLVACAPQQEGRPAAMSGQGMAGGSQGMQGHGMAGMDPRSMMAHCAEMRQQAQQGGRMSPEMREMMAHCAQMDRSMDPQRPR